MNKKEQIMNDNQIRFLENAKKYAKKMKLKIEESEIDLEKAKAITNQWYDKFFNKTKEINIDAIIKINDIQDKKISGGQDIAIQELNKTKSHNQMQ